MNHFSSYKQEAAAQRPRPAENVCLVGHEELHPTSARADGPCPQTSLTFTFRTHVVCGPVRSLLSGRHVALQVCGHEVESWPGLHFCLHIPHTQNGPARASCQHETRPNSMFVCGEGELASLAKEFNSSSFVLLRGDRNK